MQLLEKENIYLEVVYSFRSLVHFHHDGTWRQTGRQTWWWRRNLEFHIFICRQQDAIVLHIGCSLSIGDFKALLQSNIIPLKRTYLIVWLLTGAIFFQSVTFLPCTPLACSHIIIQNYNLSKLKKIPIIKVTKSIFPKMLLLNNRIMHSLNGNPL